MPFSNDSKQKPSLFDTCSFWITTDFSQLIWLEVSEWLWIIGVILSIWGCYEFCVSDPCPPSPDQVAQTCSVDGFLLRRPASSLALSVFISTTMSLFTSPPALDRKTHHSPPEESVCSMRVCQERGWVWLKYTDSFFPLHNTKVKKQHKQTTNSAVLGD